MFFSEKEGTSVVVRLLNNFPEISIVHQLENKGWEPFDEHNSGAMSLADLKLCLNLVYDSKKFDFEKLNSIYSKTATRSLEPFDGQNTSVGFKMRFNPHSSHKLDKKGLLKRILKSSPDFESTMIEVLKKNNILVFLMVRQDILRWALSKYHGDGTTKPGHLQFKLASGEISKSDIGKIEVDCDKLEEYIQLCEKEHEDKKKLRKTLMDQGIIVDVLLYEEFLKDDSEYLKNLTSKLELNYSDENIQEAMNSGGYFKKVHSDDISEFVINYEEVLNRFGDRFNDWSSYCL